MGTNENVKKKSFSKAIIAVVVLVLIVLGFGFAYARYITRLNGSTQVPIAQWNFKVTAGSSQSLDIDLSGTRFLDDTTEVDRTKVAPGTAGALQFNINATGSQVSLEYTIDLTLTQIPENLIFYSDAEMTKALYKDNGVIHLDGYFGASDNNKTATQNLYWQWKLETGSTQAEINANDLLDSEWIGDRIVLGVQATGRQVMDSPTTQYAVTFDLNGGILANHGDSTQITKNVTYGETYGALPTPTRDGYEFKGWNGKNMLDLRGWLDWCSSATRGSILKENDTIRITATSNDAYTNTYRYNLTIDSNQYFTIPVKANTTYTFSWKSDSDKTGLNYIFMNDKQVDGYYPCALNKYKKLTFTTRSDVDYITIRLGVNNSGESITYSELQIEEGSTATAYEPYYITESTEVVQNQNHTLTAIWEKDE